MDGLSGGEDIKEGFLEEVIFDLCFNYEINFKWVEVSSIEEMICKVIEMRKKLSRNVWRIIGFLLLMNKYG